MTGTIAVIAIALVAAWVADRWIRRRVWGKKSTEELADILTGAEWRKWELALRELQRRGHDTSPTIKPLATRLLSGSKWERTAARIVLMNVYPETRPFLKNYDSEGDEATRRKSLEAFFAKYNVSAGQRAV
jgi:hypothetical protein